MNRLLRLVLALTLLAVMMMPSTALAIDSVTQLLTPFYDPSSGSCSAGGTVYKFVQTLAFHESRDNPMDTNGIAFGKYQYEPATWKSNAGTYYNPANQYNDNILSAPEYVQDALAYIEYSVKAIEFGGNIQEMAAYHYAPADATDPSGWANEGGTLTVQDYVDQFMQQYNAGDGQTDPLKFEQAPDFDAQYLKAVGHPYSAGNDGLGGDCSAASTPAGSFVFYDQTDSRWASHLIYTGNLCGTPPQPDNIACAGCGPTSAAMVIATMKDSSVTPDQVGDYMTQISGYSDEGASAAGLTQAVEHWGLKTVPVDNMDQAIQLIKNGGLVIAGGTGAHPFSSDGHVVVLRGIDVSGNMLVGNPSLPLNDGDKDNSYPVTTIQAGLQYMIGVTQ